MFRDVHELYSYFLFSLNVFCKNNFSEATFPKDFSNFVLVKDCAIIEVFSIKSHIDYIIVLNKLYVLIHYLESILHIEFGSAYFLFLIEMSTRFLEDVSQTQLSAIGQI